MSLELGDTETFDGSIADGATEELEVKTSTADYVQVLIDDGTTGGVPASYDLNQDYYVPSVDDYMRYSEQTGQTATSIRSSTRGARLRFAFTNSSGAPADYRIVVNTFKEI